MIPTFLEAKESFDKGLGLQQLLPSSIVPVHGKIVSSIAIRNDAGEPFEEYYKWQFISAVINAGLFPKSHIGTEVHFPKGTGQDLRLDGAIFDDASWLTRYKNYWFGNKDNQDLEWLQQHLLAVIEFKRREPNMERVFMRQMKPAMREKDPAQAFVLGIFYDKERLLLFQRTDGRYLRYDPAKNDKGEKSSANELCLHLTDPYEYIPSLGTLVLGNPESALSRSGRRITDLGVITSIRTVQIKDALSVVLRTLDRYNLVDQRGYRILIEAFALKIFDEKRNAKTPSKPLEFYVDAAEATFAAITEADVQNFIRRLKKLHSEASNSYSAILTKDTIDWNSQHHVRAVASIVQAFQDLSFVRSSKSDLYQLVFYNFANSFKRDESAQFLTPIPVIDFLVKIVNPRRQDSVCDPCCGIGDFLSLSFVHSDSLGPGESLDEANIYGVDVDVNMITLATLNMILNGDGDAKLLCAPGHGSILSKVAVGMPAHLVDLVPALNSRGQWDVRLDNEQLRKFDVVLTNPPFGEDRAFRPSDDSELALISCYETWELSGDGGAIDKGIVFLENAIQLLGQNGRMGIVVSNSIASVERWRKVRLWLMDKIRIVALFDLPSGVFAETDVNTTLIIGYKPSADELLNLNDQGYEIFTREITRVGYEKRTKQRNVVFNPLYVMDPVIFEAVPDEMGHPKLDEEFTQTVAEFQRWALAQETPLREAFVGGEY
ncbi:MAG: HsdM family class I SAM-dependent methyltransferase [Ferrimicrobium acidiphilum]